MHAGYGYWISHCSYEDILVPSATLEAWTIASFNSLLTLVMLTPIESEHNIDPWMDKSGWPARYKPMKQPRLLIDISKAVDLFNPCNYKICDRLKGKNVSQRFINLVFGYLVHRTHQATTNGELSGSAHISLHGYSTKVKAWTTGMTCIHFQPKSERLHYYKIWGWICTLYTSAKKINN